MIGIRFHDHGIPKRLLTAIKKAAEALRSHSPLRHVIDIHCYPTALLVDRDEDNSYYYGLFTAFATAVSIDVACGLARELRRCGDSADDAQAAVLHTLFHEWIHYEQFRDGKEQTERGVNQKATALMEKLGFRGGR